jgi:hypothetical protein
MKYKLEHQTNSWGTHQPVLYDMCSKPRLNILELGCGHNSTQLLSKLALRYNSHVYSFESNEEWVNQCRQYENSNLKLFHIPDWIEFLEKDTYQIQENFFNIIFVDQSPWEARQLSIEKMRFKCHYLILHDADYFPTNKMFDFKDYFQYYRLFLPNEPMPYFTGPPTLLASNFLSCDMDIDYSITEVDI